VIGFNELGRKGNLGNQMFQYAALRGVAENRGFTWAMPPEDESRIHDYALFRYFYMGSTTSENLRYVPFRTFYTSWRHRPNSTEFGFDAKFFNSLPDNSNINGFFQSEKYFSKISDTIRSDFTFKNEFREEALRFKEYIGGSFVSLHIRRGDYVENPGYLTVLPLSYYEEALSLVRSDLPIAVFTNDKEWAKSQPLFCQSHVVIIDYEDYGRDLALMSLADEAIIANSSFSWWGAWLTSSAKVVAPLDWFGPRLKRRHQNKDIIPGSWKVI
jgi:hypothetical protein